VLNKIDNHDPEKFLNTSVHDLEDYYYSHYMVEPIELHEDKIVADVEDTKPLGTFIFLAIILHPF